MKSGFFLDTSDFAAGLKQFENAAPAELRRGLLKAVNECLRDARDITPRAPKKKGILWSSRTVIDETQRVAGRRSAVDTITFGFNVPYAAKWHEIGLDKKINWTLPGSGPKFLEIKMSVYRKKYLWIIGRHLENVYKMQSRMPKKVKF